MAYMSMGLGVTEAFDEYETALATYKGRGCEDTTSPQCEGDYRTILAYAERNALHDAGVRGLSLEQVKAELAKGSPMIAGIPQGVIVNALGVAKTKVMVATGRHKPSRKTNASGMNVSDVKTALLAERVEQLEAERLRRDQAQELALQRELDTRLREIERGKGIARSQVIVRPLALLAATGIVVAGLYRWASKD